MAILSEPHASRLRVDKSETTRVVVWNGASLDRCGPLDRAQIVEALNALGMSSLNSLNGTLLESSGPAEKLLEEMLFAYDFGAIVSCTLPVSAYSLESLNLIPISALCLSTRPQNCLSDAGFTKIGHLPLRRIEVLLNLLNLGKISLLEIYRKINATLIGQVRQSHNDIVRVPLGALIQIGEWDPLEHITEFIGSHDRLIGELAMLQESEIRAGLRLTEGQYFALQCQLVVLGLDIGSALPSWFKAHSAELRAAFAPELKRLCGNLPKLDLPLEVRAEVFTEQPSPAKPPDEVQLTQVNEPRCLEDEFLTYFRPGVSATNQEIIVKHMGWDGSDGATLEEVGLSVGLTRERIRQIVASSLKKPDGIDTRLLRRAISAISRSVPISLKDSAALLQCAGITHGKMTARQIQRTAGYFGIDHPWFTEKYRNEYLVVDDASKAVIRECQSEALRRIRHFGVTSVQHVSKKLGRNGTEVLLYCSLIDGLVWLDEDQNWFWAPSARNVIAGRLAKILEAVVRVPIETAHQAVLRDHRMAGTELPLQVFHAVCGLFGWCRIEEDEIVRIGDLPETEQDTNETRLVSIFREHGPVLERSYLYRLAIQTGISEASLNMLLSFSTLIVRLGESLYGLIGSTMADHRGIESKENFPIASENSVRQESISADLLAGCDPLSPTFPRQALARAAKRCRPLRAGGRLWSLAELGLSRKDYDTLAIWVGQGSADIKAIQLSDPKNALWIDGREALAFTFLLACSYLAWNHAVEGDMWNAIETAFHPPMRRKLFHAPGVPKALLRNETERVCSRWGIRHLFGREGEQSWLRTVFLQFGLTRTGWSRLPIWLRPGSVLPVALRELLESPALKSESFGQFWRTLQRFRQGSEPIETAAMAISDSPWVPPGQGTAILMAAKEPADRASDEHPDETPTRTSLFGKPSLVWHGSEPQFRVPVNSHASLLTEKRYLLVLADERKLALIRTSDGYTLDLGVRSFTCTLDISRFSIDVRRGGVSCLTTPLQIDLLPSDDFAFFDLRSGAQLESSDRIAGRACTLLCRDVVALNDKPPEFSRVFGGKWTLYPFRNGVPASLRLSIEDAILWEAALPNSRSRSSNRPRGRVTSFGGRWGETAVFRVRVPEGIPEFLLLNGERIPIERQQQGTGEVRVVLQAVVNYGDALARVESRCGERLRWYSADLEVGTVEGVAIETALGWTVPSSVSDLDIADLSAALLLAKPPSRLRGEEVALEDWAWLEGEHLCVRPRNEAMKVGPYVYGVGEPLELCVGPYNRRYNWAPVTRAVVQSGVLACATCLGDFCRLTLRSDLELGSDHDLWMWRHDAVAPERIPHEHWSQSEDQCEVKVAHDASPLAFAVSYEGAWIGAWTLSQEWARLLRNRMGRQDWSLTAKWLKWWRVPLLHPDLIDHTKAAVHRDRLRTFLAWVSTEPPCPFTSSEEDFDAAWRYIARKLFWRWHVNPEQAKTILQELALLSGEGAMDMEKGWSGFDRLMLISPLLAVRIAVQGATVLYTNKVERDFILRSLLARILDSSQDTMVRLSEVREEAARSMNVDIAFVANGILRDALESWNGKEVDDRNLRIATTNSLAVPKFLSAELLQRALNGELHA
jgi:hypothetical protein